MIIIISTLSSL